MVKNTIISRQIKDKITVFAKLLKESGITVEKIILYGSYAKGHPHEYSDIDLCVISPSFVNGDKYPDYYHQVWALADKVDHAFEPIPFSQDDLDNKYSSLSSEIRKHGVRVL